MNTTIEVNNTPTEKREESPEEIALRQQQEAKDKEMITKYYGGPNIAAKRTIHSFVLEGNDLFNDDLVDALSALPTYTRSKQDITDLEGKRRELATS